MLTPVPPTECMSAREAASARLDEEISELDAARLDAHLLACPACRAYAAGIAGIVAELRAAALESPSLEQRRVEVGISRRRRMPVVAAAAAATLVAAVTGSSFAVGRVLGAHTTHATRVSTVAGTADAVRLRQDAVQQHLLAMLNSFESTPPTRAGRMRAV